MSVDLRQAKESSRKRTLIAPPASSPAVASVMKGNKKRDSRPELTVRRLLHELGYRYRLHARDLPGSPDIAFRSRKKVIFVHGCFWHQHQSARCALRSHPKRNLHYWRPKLAGNRARDVRNRRELARLGWSTLVVWECELSSPQTLSRRLAAFLA